VREGQLVRLRSRLRPAGRERADLLGVSAGSRETLSVLDALRAKLPTGHLVLEYFQAGDDVVLFLISRDRLVTRRLGPMESVIGLAERLDYQMRKFQLGGEYVSNHQDSLLAGVKPLLRSLYATLIEPIEPHLEDTTSLQVVPHGVLHYLPFHAFLAANGSALVDRCELSYAASAGVLAACLARGGVTGGISHPLIMGVPDERIPQVTEEVQALGKLFGEDRTLLGDAATLAAFHERAPEADAIHLASHAVFREDNPLFSALRLADGWLSLYDVYTLRLQAKLVTLSACDTGVNRLLAGDEIVGLSRGFLHAGTSSMVVSLWAVNDESTAMLMDHFYRAVCSGETPSHALRLAQMEVRKKCPHPYYWAPFLVLGHP
jgi:CHAT domain-containing protein